MSSRGLFHTCELFRVHCKRDFSSGRFGDIFEWKRGQYLEIVNDDGRDIYKRKDMRYWSDMHVTFSKFGIWRRRLVCGYFWDYVAENLLRNVFFKIIFTGLVCW